MIRLSKNIYQMNVTRTVNSSQSFCSIAAAGAIFSPAEIKAMFNEKRWIYKIVHLCKHFLDQNVV